MSQNQLVRNPGSAHELIEEQMEIEKPILDVYESEHIDDAHHEDRVKQFYKAQEYPICEDYKEPDLQPIKTLREKEGKVLALRNEMSKAGQLICKDGLYQQTTQISQREAEVLRQKIRIAHDLRQQFFQDNGEYIIQKQFFQEQLSRLANISLQENLAIKTFQKNAILSERTNQKKMIPFELQICFGELFISKHPLNNEEQQKFQQIRPYLKQLSIVAAYPLLPQLSKELQFLRAAKARLVDERNEDPNTIRQLNKKIDIAREQYEKEARKIHQLMRKILQGWNQIKQIRRINGFESVPYRFHVKEYEHNGKNSYDMGMLQVQLQEKAIGKLSEADHQERRRESIKSESYQLRIIINSKQVGQTEKKNLQWPHFRVPFADKFNVMLYSAPRSISLQVIKCGIFNQVIDTVDIALPGKNAKTVTSAETRFSEVSFARNGGQMRQSKSQVAAPAGSLFYRIQWKGQSNKMPQISEKTLEEETVDTEHDESADIETQKLFDERDPRVVPKKLKEKIKIENQIRGTNALLPFAGIQSIRHLLLKLKATMPELEQVQIPLTDQEIRRRDDLIRIVDRERARHAEAPEELLQHHFNPLEGIFSEQKEVVLRDIREVLDKIKNMSGKSGRGTSSGRRYKLTQQVIGEYIIEQMESPIVIFCRNLFTQQRKLGPSVNQKFKTRAKIDQIQINLHVRSAKNLPIRQSSFERIRKLQSEQLRLPMMQQQMPNNYNNQMFFKHNAQMNMGGNSFISYQNDDPSSLNRINGFVEFRFNKTTKYTQCFQGPFPEWNETLTTSYSMKNENTTLEKMFLSNTEPLKLFVFDMLEESKPTQAISEARVKKTKVFIGKIQIPFPFIVAVPSITGLFKLDRPLILFQYGIRRNSLFSAEDDPQDEKRPENPQVHTYMNLNLFTEPIIDSMIAYNSDHKFNPGANQNPIVLQRAADWLEELSTKRYMRLWLNDIEGRSVLICRFLSDTISPPKLGNDLDDHLIERCARFVSLIPKKSNCRLLDNTQQFHMLADEFLNVKMGDDHGILLCNYFNFVDRNQGRRNVQSVLAVCKAFPYGKCIFVLRRNRESNNCQLWDPYRGQCYYFPAKQYDTFCFCIKYQRKAQNAEVSKDICPVIELSCLVSKENVYYNKQQSTKPATMDFDLENESLWQPFLNERLRNQIFEKGQIATIQHRIPQQFYPPLINPRALETSIFDFLKDRMAKDRKNLVKPYTFKINLKISNMVTNRLLQLCENFKNDIRTSGAESQFYTGRHRENNDASVQRLLEQKMKINGEVSVNKNLFGFPLNMTYTTHMDVFERVAETKLHLDENDDLDFVLSVRCFEHVCHIFSVWVFIGSIG